MVTSAAQSELPLYPKNCRASKGEFEPYVLAREAEQVSGSCGSIATNIITCQNPGLQSTIDKIDGLGFNSVIAKNKIEIDIPNYIPIVSRDFFKFNSDLVDTEFVGVSLKDIITSPPSVYAGGMHLPKIKLREDILKQPFFEGKKVLLFMTGADTLIEKAWEEKEGLSLAERLVKMGFALVTAINFSVFFYECVVGQQLNLKKSLKSFELFEAAGLPIVPHVYWSNTPQLHRWVKWLQDNPLVQMASINCQRYGRADYRIIQAGIKYMLNSVGSKLNLLLEGPPRDFLPDLVDYNSQIRIAMKAPALDAVFHKKDRFTGDGLKVIRTTHSMDGLLNENVKAYGNYFHHKFFNH